MMCGTAPTPPGVRRGRAGLYILWATLACAVLAAPARADDDPTPDLHPVQIAPEAVRAEGLEIVRATQGSLSGMLAVMARVMPDTTRVVAVRPAGSGKVLDIAVQPGAHVTKGSVLLHYQDHSLHAAFEQSAQLAAALSAARAARDDAAAAYQRGLALAGQTIAVGEVRRRKDALAQAQATVQTLEAQHNTLSHRFEQEFTSPSESMGQGETSALIAPLSGVVSALDTAVTADISPATPVATVADLSSVWVVSDVVPEDAARLAPGGRQVTTLGDGSILSRIDSVDQAANLQTGLVRVISTVPNPTGALVPGMVLNATLQTRQAMQGVLVPTDAIQVVDGRNVVFVRESPTSYRPAPVTIGLESGGQALVLSGLKDGEPVVSHGSFALKSVLLLAGMDTD
ncbi:efflux RND transporter periplasmic adaptor subunit [Acetobacter garciniae]|nr:efflux RND transporter periplasmic adaptor subunit [Acetobacter garciniae]